MNLSQEFVELIFEQIKGLIVVDADAKIIYINKNWANELGYEPEQVIGKPIREVIPFTKMDVTVKTQKPDIGDFYYFKGRTNVCNRLPIFKDGKLVGAIAFSIFDDLTLASSFTRRLEHMKSELDYYKDEIRKLRGASYTINNIIGKSVLINELKEQIFYAAKTNSTVLIQGETGTGKELVANSIHDLSKRRLSNIVKINCSAIPTELFESEMFGYEDGSFTGAKKGGKIGKFELAKMGTLFFDEIDQMPQLMQSKLLRVIQEKEIERVGGNNLIPVDVRIIAATNNDLETLAEEGKFRMDLFYRLNVIRINIPPLRKHKEDIPLLAKSFIEKLNYDLGSNIHQISDEAMELLMEHDWPGNIRELGNAVERAMNSAKGERIEADDFYWLQSKSTKLFTKEVPQKKENICNNSLKETKCDAEKLAILEAIKKSNGNKAEAARILKISRTFLYKRMKQLDIEV